MVVEGFRDFKSLKLAVSEYRKGRQLPSRFRGSVTENRLEAQLPPDALPGLWLRTGWGTGNTAEE